VVTPLKAENERVHDGSTVATVENDALTVPADIAHAESMALVMPAAAVAAVLQLASMAWAAA
jgi:hypothetical protein